MAGIIISMSSTQLDQFAAAALSGLLARRDWPDHEELARTAFSVAKAMMAERTSQNELPDSAANVGDLTAAPLSALELPLRIQKKLATLDIKTVRELTLTTEADIRATGLGDESLQEIRQALHRLGLKLA
jgi:DNA-directed RNA polymerase alpha subunit